MQQTDHRPEKRRTNNRIRPHKTTLTGLIIGLHFMHHNSAILDITHRIINFPHLSMQANSTEEQKISKPQAVMIPEDTTIPPLMTRTTKAFATHFTQFNPTGRLNPAEQFTKTSKLIIPQSMSPVANSEVPIRVTNASESPYTLKKNTQVAEVAVLTPQQHKHIKPVDTAILKMMHDDDPELNLYLNELLRSNKQNQQDTNFGFPTPENRGNVEEHTPIQTRILNELNELRREEKLNPQDYPHFREEFLKQFSWKDTLLTLNEQNKVEEILVEYHDVIARHRMDIGMNTEFKVKRTPKDDKPVYSQSLPMPIHVKEDVPGELALLHKYGIITVSVLSLNTRVPLFAKRKPNGNLRLLVEFRKINRLISDEHIKNKSSSKHSYQMQHNTWLKNRYYVILDCSQTYHCL